MPPVHKLSKQSIVTTARRLVSESGPQALNARELGRLMGVSARPIYSHFASMDELRQAVFSTIVRDYVDGLVTSQDSGDRFLDVGLAQIRFARDNPREYRLLYDQEGCNLGTTQAIRDRTLDHIEQSGPYRGLGRPTMDDLLQKMSIFTHGLATMVNQGALADNSDAEILRLLRQTGGALIAWAQRQEQGENLS